MIFIIIIGILLGLYALAVFLMRYMKNVRTVNTVFFLLTTLIYWVYVLMVYLQVGAKSIYFHGVLATANVSPFMFTALPIIYFSRGKLKEHLYLLVSLLSVGMFFSPIFNAISYAVSGVPFQVLPVLDYVGHLSLSLWGIYLVRSGQVTLNPKKALTSGLIIVGVADIMLVLNLIFDTSFFGLSLKGKHNIYGNVLTENSYLSAIIYFAGLAVILLLGYASARLIEKHKIT